MAMMEATKVFYAEQQLKKMNGYVAKDSLSISNMCEMLKNLHADEESIVNGLLDLVNKVCLYPAVHCQICFVLVDSQSEQITTHECDSCHDEVLVCSDCFTRLYTPKLSNSFCRYCMEEVFYGEPKNKKKKKKESTHLKRRTSKELVFNGSKKRHRGELYHPYARIRPAFQ
jgi:hypothetical protein